MTIYNFIYEIVAMTIYSFIYEIVNRFITHDGK
jgi:hypothetical protein